MLSGKPDQNYYKFLLAAVICFCLAGLAMLFDISVAKSCRAGSLLPGDLKVVVRLAEVFAHGAGVGLIVLCIWATMNSDRRKIMRLVCCAIAPGIIVNILKFSVIRSRPKSLKNLPENAVDTFGGFFPSFHESETVNFVQHQFQSFPSGHSATAVGFAIGLSWLFPRGKWCFALFALLAMFQRLESGSHFLSDTLVGAGLACLIAGRFVSTSWEGRRFAAFEKTGKQNSNDDQQDQA